MIRIAENCPMSDWRSRVVMRNVAYKETTSVYQSRQHEPRQYKDGKSAKRHGRPSARPHRIEVDTGAERSGRRPTTMMSSGEIAANDTENINHVCQAVSGGQYPRDIAHSVRCCSLLKLTRCSVRIYLSSVSSRCRYREEMDGISSALGEALTHQ